MTVYPADDHGALATALGIIPGETVLDVGGGGNPFSRADVVVDIDFRSGRHRGGAVADLSFLNHQYVTADIESLPFPDNAFDVVVCIQVLEHVDDPARACEELMRVARRGFLETPRKWTEYYAGYPTHQWLVDECDGVLVFEPIPYRSSPFLNFALPALWNSEMLFEKALVKHRNIPSVQWVWKDRFDYRVLPIHELEDDAKDIAAERQYHYALNLLYFMTSPSQVLFHAAEANQGPTDDESYARLHRFCLAMSGQWRAAFANGISIKQFLLALLASILTSVFRTVEKYYRRIINSVFQIR